MPSDHVALVQADSELGEEQEVLRLTTGLKKTTCACIAAATLLLMFASVGRARSLTAVDPAGLVSKEGEFPDHFPEYISARFINDCAHSFKEGNKETVKWSGGGKTKDHQFKEDKLDSLCKRYWSGYLKAWTPWDPAKAMYPSAESISDWASSCWDRTSHTKKWWSKGRMNYAKFMYPVAEGEMGNYFAADCGKFLEFLAEYSDEEPEDEIIPEAEQKPCHEDGLKAVKVKDGYCHSDRSPLGSSNGKGHTSLVACGNLARSSDMCHSDGYFDAVKWPDGTFQCQCPSGICVQSSNPQSAGWAIYQLELGTPNCS